jgi:hypothetical protein
MTLSILFCERGAHVSFICLKFCQKDELIVANLVLMVLNKNYLANKVILEIKCYNNILVL